MKSINFVMIALAAVLVSAGTAFASINISGGNNTTGCDSENENNWCIDGGNVIDVFNCAEAKNDFDVCVETGDNLIGYNTCVGNVVTGDIAGSVMFENILNDSNFVLAPASAGNINVVLANSLTGPGSENENNVAIRNKNRVEIVNLSNIKNDIDFNANTGNNVIKKNTSVAGVQTGNINFSADVTNIANGGMNVNLSSLMPTTNVSVSAGNNTTGPCSENENNISIDNSSRVNVVNQSSIKNDVDVNANTGNNRIECNTVVGNVRTGSISIDYTAVNSAN